MTYKIYRRRRGIVGMLIAVLLAILGVFIETNAQQQIDQANQKIVVSKEQTSKTRASEALDTISIKGRAPKTDYRRVAFGDGWRMNGECSTRDLILARDLRKTAIEQCKVLRGELQDPYTAQTILFQRGPDTSDDIQIDHMVALSDAWQKGAQQLDTITRENFANDPLNLLAVQGQANQDKGDSDAASWLPPNKDYRCRYVARQIAVKQKYSLWMTQSEKEAISSVLATCPTQMVPTL